MAYSLSTNTLTQILEATDFSRTVTINSAALDPPITSITVTKVGEINGNIVITTGASSFTISGQYNNNFTKTVTYQDKNKESVTVTSKTAFSALPADYFMIVEYLASLTTTFTASFTVAVNGSYIDTVTQQVNNNYTPGKDSLIAAVAGGKV